MVSFALVQLSKKHTEIFGTFIEIILHNNWDLYMYYNKNDDPYTFINYYETIFKTKFNIRKSSSLMNHKDDHDFYIFTSSADDVRMDDYFKSTHMANKCIFVNHQAPHWRPYMHKNILMSPVITSPELNKEKYETIVPIYKSYKKMHANIKQTNLAIIGAIRPHQKDKDLKLLTNLLETYPNEEYNIYVFMRKMDWKVISNRNPFLKNNPHIQFFSGLSTDKMIEKLKEVKFILPLSKKDGWFYWQRLTGTIPLAINLNIPLIMDKKLAKIYDLEEACLLYDKNISEIMPKILSISDEKYFELIENVVLYKKEIYKINTKRFINLCLSQVNIEPEYEKNDLKRNLLTYS